MILQSTLITKLVSNRRFKLRLCIRGDRQPEAAADFVSAPKAAREYISIAVMLFINDSPYVFKTVDVSMAFTQSDYYCKQDRVWVEMPRFARPASPHSKGELFSDSTRSIAGVPNGACLLGLILVKRAMEFNFLSRYMAPAAPRCDGTSGWQKYSSLALFRWGGQCVYSRSRALGKGEVGYARNAVLANACIVVVDVDDIIFPGIRGVWRDLRLSTGELKRGEREGFSQDRDIPSSGIVIILKKDRIAEMTQHPYYEKAPR